MRSARSAIICMSCSIQIIVMFNSCLMRRMKRARSSRSARLRPADGSSSSMMVGSSASARAKPTIFCTPDGSMAIAFELHQIDDALDRLAMRDFGAAYVRQEQHLGHRIGADARVTAGQQVVEHAHLREQLAVLERAGETEPGNLVRRASGNVLAAETDGAAAAIDAADAVERAGLAGAIRADQRKQLARGNRKRYVVKHGQAAEAQA